MLMMKKILAILLIVMSFTLKAQDCGFDHVIQEMIQKDPGKKNEILKNISALAQKQGNTQTLSGSNPLYIIPVVVHVVHDGGVSNISEAQVLNGIKKLNEDFRKLNADTSGIVSSFVNIAADARFEFRLATIDPNGNCTKGITRTFSFLTNVGDGEPIKDLISWDTKKYYNIWVVNYLESGGNSVGGYSYLPGTAPSQSHEGTIVIHKQFGSIGTSYAVPGAIHTLAHETGHFFGLLHTWGLTAIGTVCGNDGIADTPPTKGSNGTCSLGQNLCSGLENVQNIMDYSSCPCMFTQNQATYMQNSAASSVGYRSSLWAPNNLIATGTENNHVVTECTPTPYFKAHNDSTFFCVGTTISFDDLSYNDTLATHRIHEWTFEGGTPASSSLANPMVTYNNVGIYDVKLKISNANGTDSITFSNYIQVVDNISSKTVPFFEGFEDTGFPDNLNNKSDWTIVTPGTEKFTRTTVAKKSGSASLVLDLHAESGYGSSEMWHYLMSPNIDLSSFSDSIFLDFNFAYAQRTAGNNDLLRVYISTDCGLNWILKKNMNYVQLTTKTPTTNNFVPSVSEWGNASIDMSAFVGYPDIRIMFAVNAKGGNKLYLDNISMYHINVSVEEQNASEFSTYIYPNPINSNSIIEINSSTPNNFKISLYNALGEQIGQSVSVLNSKDSKLPLSEIQENIASGIYFLQVNAGSETRRIKIIK